MDDSVIKVRLPRKAKGGELAEIIENSFSSIKGYEVTKECDGVYVPGSVKLNETIEFIYGAKKLPAGPKSLGGKIACAAIPVIGWAYYGIEKLLGAGININTSVEKDKEYEELEFMVYRHNGTDFDTISARRLNCGYKGYKEVKDDFETLIKNIYARLGHPSASAA